MWTKNPIAWAAQPGPQNVGLWAALLVSLPAALPVHLAGWNGDCAANGRGGLSWPRVSSCRQGSCSLLALRALHISRAAGCVFQTLLALAFVNLSCSVWWISCLNQMAWLFEGRH